MIGPRGRHGRRRRSSRVRFDWLRRTSPAGALAGLSWNPGDARRQKDDGSRAWRLAALVIALCEAALLAWLLAGPAFQVRHVDVAGATHLRSPEVVAAAGLDRPRSLFAVDAATIRRKLTANPWIRDASVTASLPDRVALSVEEWAPVAVYVAGGRGRPMFLSDQAAVLGSAAAGGAALEIDGPAGPDPRVGSHPVDPRLLTAMVNIQRGLPGLAGQQVRSFSIDGCGNLSMTVQRGFRVDFGRVITPEEYGALDQKLAALKSVAARENLNSPDVEYVNLQNAQLPAVGLRSRPSPPPAPAPAPSAAPKTVTGCR